MLPIRAQVQDKASKVLLKWSHAAKRLKGFDLLGPECRGVIEIV